VTKRAMAPLVADNPHLAEVVTLEPGEPIRHLARRLRALAPTHGLDLHGSVRSASLRVLVGCRWSGYRKRKLARALLIATKLDAYRRRAPSPVAERYFEGARCSPGRGSWCRAIPASCTWPRASGHQSSRCSDPPSGSSASSRIARGRPYWSARSTAVPAPRRAPPPARSATIAVLRTSLPQRWPQRWSASSRDPGDHCRGGALDRVGRGRRPGTQAGGPVRAVARRALRRGAPAAAPRVGQE